jgi:hypothetical protein
VQLQGLRGTAEPQPGRAAWQGIATTWFVVAGCRHDTGAAVAGNISSVQKCSREQQQLSSTLGPRPPDDELEALQNTAFKGRIHS